MATCVSFPTHLPYKIHQSSKPYLFFNQGTSKLYFFVCSSSSSSSSITTTSPTITPVGGGGRKRIRNRKLNPGEKEGIVEEMRFISMKLHTSHVNEVVDENADSPTATWQPYMEGFLNYLVDSKFVFETLERIVEDSSDVTYVYFRKTGLERSASLAKDLEWFKEQGLAIPEPSSPGTGYGSYLADLAEISAPSFFCHFYNIYYAHLYGGCAIGRQDSKVKLDMDSVGLEYSEDSVHVKKWRHLCGPLTSPKYDENYLLAHFFIRSPLVCEKLLLGRKLEFYKWEGDAQKLLKNVRENLNKLGEHWPRIEKNKCLKEAAKSFKFSGQIVRLIVLSKN